jgi:hypothetical protein
MPSGLRRNWRGPSSNPRRAELAGLASGFLSLSKLSTATELPEHKRCAVAEKPNG